MFNAPSAKRRLCFFRQLHYSFVTSFFFFHSWSQLSCPLLVFLLLQLYLFISQDYTFFVISSVILIFFFLGRQLSLQCSYSAAKLRLQSSFHPPAADSILLLKRVSLRYILLIIHFDTFHIDNL